jgi:hypothetical protein
MRQITNNEVSVAIPIYKEIKETLGWETNTKVLVKVVEENGEKILRIERVEY